MRVPFIRPLRRCSWLPIEWAGPVEGYTLRECHLAFLLSSLPGAIRALLLDWLLDPSDLRRWPPSSSVPTRRLFFAAGDLLNKTAEDYYALTRDELASIRETLDFPSEVLSGFTRNCLLVAHRARLRQLVEVMQPAVAERAFKKLIT